MSESESKPVSVTLDELKQAARIITDTNINALRKSESFHIFDVQKQWYYDELRGMWALLQPIESMPSEQLREWKTYIEALQAEIRSIKWPLE